MKQQQPIEPGITSGPSTMESASFCAEDCAEVVPFCTTEISADNPAGNPAGNLADNPADSTTITTTTTTTPKGQQFASRYDPEFWNTDLTAEEISRLHHVRPWVAEIAKTCSEGTVSLATIFATIKDRSRNLKRAFTTPKGSDYSPSSNLGGMTPEEFLFLAKYIVVDDRLGMVMGLLEEIPEVHEPDFERSHPEWNFVTKLLRPILGEMVALRVDAVRLAAARAEKAGGSAVHAAAEIRRLAAEINRVKEAA